MKKSGLFIVMFLLMFASISYVIAEEQEQVDAAYECLLGKINSTGCNSLSPHERIFSLLIDSECKEAVEADSRNDEDECWPSGSACSIKTTALAVLALNERGVDTTKAEDWLFSQNMTPTDLNWYLQIDTTENPDSCTVTYSGTPYVVNIAEDRSLSFATSGGSCLKLNVAGDTHSDYWLRIDSDCYDQEYEVTCDGSFAASLLFKKQGSSTVNVLQNTQHGTEGGSVTLKIDSLCFSTGTSCDYEGTLWAGLVLNTLGYEAVSSFKPYLLAMSEDIDNLKYFPDSFLYILTGYSEFNANIWNQQKPQGYWEVGSVSKYYDSSVALLYFMGKEIEGKTKTKNWLLSGQGGDGCWGSIVDTSFVLYSIFGTSYQGVECTTDDDCDAGEICSGGICVPSNIISTTDCEDEGYSCISSGDCASAGGFDVGYSGCSGISICCSQSATLESCLEMAGEICTGTEVCAGYEDTALDGSCCIGDCIEPGDDTNVCEDSYGGVCDFSCDDDQDEEAYACSEAGDVCCVDKSSEGGSYWWIFVLGGLIILVVLGILFRDKLQALWIKLKSRKSKGGFPPSRRGPGFPPQPPMMPSSPRRIMPPRGSPQRRPVQRKSSEMDDVLNKLKKMGE